MTDKTDTTDMTDNTDITVLTCEGAATVDGVVADESVLLAASSLDAATGWELKPQGLCRGDVCVPVDSGSIFVEDRLDLVAVAAALQAPIAWDAPSRAVAFGEPAPLRSSSLEGTTAPDFALERLDGGTFRFSSLGRHKKLLVAWASW